MPVRFIASGAVRDFSPTISVDFPARAAATKMKWPQKNARIAKKNNISSCLCALCVPFRQKKWNCRIPRYCTARIKRDKKKSERWSQKDVYDSMFVTERKYKPWMAQGGKAATRGLKAGSEARSPAGTRCISHSRLAASPSADSSLLFSFLASAGN